MPNIKGLVLTKKSYTNLVLDLLNNQDYAAKRIGRTSGIEINMSIKASLEEAADIRQKLMTVLENSGGVVRFILSEITDSKKPSPAE